jgi:hypothetical protein
MTEANSASHHHEDDTARDDDEGREFGDVLFARPHEPSGLLGALAGFHDLSRRD